MCQLHPCADRQRGTGFGSFMKLLLVRHAQSHNNCVQGQVQLKLRRGVTTFEQAQVGSGGSV